MLTALLRVKEKKLPPAHCSVAVDMYVVQFITELTYSAELLKHHESKANSNGFQRTLSCEFFPK